jgi:phosphate-selective porin
MEARLQTSMWTLGINWYALPNLVIKADWTTRHIGTDKVFTTHSRYTSENDLSIGVAYVGWWAKK